MRKGSLSFGTKEFIEVETGEIVNVPTIYQEASDSNFEKIWMAQILIALEELGNKKIQILSYLFRNRIISNNMVPKTLQEIATETGISYPTVSETIHILQKNNLITRKVGRIYLEPSMIFKGTHDNRMRVLFEFRQIAAEQNTPNQREEERKLLQPAPDLPKQSKQKQVKAKKKKAGTEK